MLEFKNRAVFITGVVRGYALDECRVSDVKSDNVPLLGSVLEVPYA